MNRRERIEEVAKRVIAFVADEAARREKMSGDIQGNTWDQPELLYPVADMIGACMEDEEEVKGLNDPESKMLIRMALREYCSARFNPEICGDASEYVDKRYVPDERGMGYSKQFLIKKKADVLRRCEMAMRLSDEF